MQLISNPIDDSHRAERFRESLANNKISVDLLEYYYEEGAVYASNVGIEKDDLDTERRIVSTISVHLFTTLTTIRYERYR